MSVLMAFFATIICSCSSDPVVGKWAPNNDLSGKNVFELNEDGTVELTVDESDGTLRIEGVWSYVDGRDNTISIKYDESTAEADIDNPMAQRFALEVLKEMASRKITLILSDDKEKLITEGAGESDYFVKL